MSQSIHSLTYSALSALAICAGLFCAIIPGTAAAGTPQNVAIFDAETPFGVSNGVRSTMTPVRGGACLEGTPTQHNAPLVNLSGLPSYRDDISQFDEIWFWARSNQSGKTFSFQVRGYPNSSNQVPIAPYIEGGALTTSYQLVRIPSSVLKTATYQMGLIDTLSFGTAQPTAGHKIYIDEVWAIDYDVVNPAAAPWLGPTPPVNCGSEDVGQETAVTFSITNRGTAPLTVQSIYFEGAHSASFETDSGAFSLAAGASRAIEVRFHPVVHGDNAANLVLNHNPTPMGNQTAIAVSGLGLAPALVLSKSQLRFGEVPAGQHLAWDIEISNAGNQPLSIYGLNAGLDAFSVTPPAPLSINAGDSTTIQVFFQPGMPSTAEAELLVSSSDPLAPTVSVDLEGTGVDLGLDAYLLPIDTDAVTSSSVAISWGIPANATGVRVYFGPEMGAAPQAPLPSQRLVATLTPSAKSYTFQQLSAATDMFARVEIDTPAGLYAGTAHARTPGGPRAALDTPLREVHALAPDLLLLVMENRNVHSFSLATDVHDGGVDTLVGDTGAAWQAGPWSVLRKDGSTIPVLSVHRRSMPVEQPDYETGYGANDHLEILHVDHHLFLRLGEAIGSHENLQISGPLGLDVYVPFSDKYLETPVIQVNQVGYSPRATERWAYVSAWLGDGGALTESDVPGTANVLFDPIDALSARAQVLSGIPVALRRAADTDAAGPVFEIDLSALPQTEGAFYRVQLPGVGVSWPTQVSETAVFKAFFTVLRGLTYNRWGRDLTSDWTEWSTRPPDHPQIYTGDLTGLRVFYTETQPKTGERLFQGGHHDAGDFDVQMIHSVLPMLLMRAYEVNRDSFSDGQLLIPESGNGIPDMLDEALWNIQGWEQLQEADGGVRMGVESYRHPLGIYFADKDELPYWTYGKDAFHTMRCAGLFAQASRLVAPFDAVRAADLEERAVRAYGYAIAQGLGTASRGAVFYGAGELFRLTQDYEYATLYEDAWHAMNKFGRGAYDGNFTLLPWTSSYMDPVQPVANDYLLGYFSGLGYDPQLREIAVNDLEGDATNAVEDVAGLYAHRNGRKLGMQPTWGQGTAVGEYVMRIAAKLSIDGMQPDQVQEYFNAISLSADYVLGCNPNGLVWLTGLGTRYPLEPLHLDALTFLKAGKGLLPGIPVFGPVTSMPSPSYYDYAENALYPAFTDHPGFHRYVDSRTFIVCNEFDLTIQARHAQLFSLLVAPGMMPSTEWFPGGSEHRSTLAPRAAIVPDLSHVPGKIGVSTMSIPWFTPASPGHK
ncbi:MAG: choice-of-anchor D domain-containing protein [Candidatus Hydrogenedentes bacterium]|nr:choice-of-anchor D domain-containing protein [Candidatus Hydrogenedentota bacterium]